MSIIHWDKSVVTFHLKEIMEDGQKQHPIATLGLSAIAIGPIVLPAVAKYGRPVAKSVIKSYLSAFRTPN